MAFEKFVFKRSFITDFINNKETDEKALYSKFYFCIFITLVFYALSFGASIGLFILKNYLIDDVFTFNDSNYLSIKQNTVNIIEVFK